MGGYACAGGAFSGGFPDEGGDDVSAVEWDSG